MPEKIIKQKQAKHLAFLNAVTPVVCFNYSAFAV